MILLFVVASLILQLYESSPLYNLGSEKGTLARIDLLNGLKIALQHSDPPPTREERRAALELAKFFNSSASDEYLQAFYSDSPDGTKVNKFLGFLNGIVYNGNPELPVWTAAEILIKMIKTKTNPDAIEEERDRARKMGVNRASSVQQQPSFNDFDFVKHYNDSRIYSLATFQPLPEAG